MRRHGNKSEGAENRGVLANDALRVQEGAREEKVRELVEFMRSKEGEAVTIRPVVFSTILNVLGNTVFSRDLYDLGGRGDVVGLELLICELLVIGATPDLADYYKFLMLDYKLDPL
ncbi:hypothetical protein Sjap_020601 [Stephania japonica]|uniref:Uncharacterized protein n=1 Tax=Stephania japonica TaxID=461633 RepID=A0AAP0HZ53_9MAGN